MEDIIDNQHATPVSTRLAWLAGIIEGEGSITLNVRRKKWRGWNGVGIDLGIQVVNTDAYIIEECVAIIEGIVGVAPKICERNAIPARYTTDGTIWKQNRQMLAIHVSKMSHIKAIIENLMPYMIGEKKARARLIVKFIDRRQSHLTAGKKGGVKWYDGYDWQIVKEFYEIKGIKLPEEIERAVRDYMQSTDMSSDDIVRTA